MFHIRLARTVTCEFCKSRFPESWIKEGKGVYDKGNFFCSKSCQDDYENEIACERFRKLVDTGQYGS